MKIKSLTIKNEDLEASFKEAIVATAIGYGKIYELLHKQLWRKGRISLVNQIVTVNGRPAKPITKWNIKSPSTSPYNRDNYNDLGLNQLFVGQKYNAQYNGNPSDGIYHDDCYIQPKGTDLTSHDRMGWYIEANGHWLEKDIWGNVITINVTSYEKFDANNVSLGWFYTVVTPSGSTEYPLLSNGVDILNNPTYPSVDYRNFSTYLRPAAIPVYPQYMVIPDMSVHGPIVYESTGVGYKIPSAYYYVSSPITPLEAITRVYADGTAIEFVAPTIYEFVNANSQDLNFVTGAMKYLPLVYTDTGDLVQNRSDFVEQWDNMFELYVYENSYWYTPLVKIAIVVVSIAAAYVSAGILSGWAASSSTMALAAFGGGISGIGAISGDKVFQVVGALISLGSSMYASGVGALSKEAMTKGLSSRTATQIAQEATFQEVFKGYISSAGFSNLLNIGSSAYGIYSTLTAKEFTQPTDSVTQDDSMKVYAIDDDEEHRDKVMELVRL